MSFQSSLLPNNLSLFILFALYTCQGIIINFFVQTLPMLLVERGSNLSDIAVMNLLVLPFSLKLFFAPFLDLYYFKRLGRRRSYIIPTNYIISGILIALSGRVESLIESKNIDVLAITGFLAIFPLSIQDIAVDGLGADLFTEEKSIYPALAQTIGISFGSFLTSNFLVLLNSHSFCNSYIFSTPRDTGVLSVSHFIFFIGIFLLSLNIYMHFFLKKPHTISSEESESEVSMKKKLFSMKIFFTDPLLRSYIIFLVFNRFAFSLMDSCFKLRLIQKGFPKEAISNILSILLLVGILFQLLLPKFLRKISEIGLFYIFFVPKLIENIASYFLIENYNEKLYDSLLFWCFLIIVCLVGHIQYNAAHGLCGSLSNKISQKVEKGFEGTTIAFLTSTFNLGRRLSDFVSLSIVEKYDFFGMAMFGWVAGSGIMWILKGKLLRLEERMKKKEKDQ